MKYKPCYYVLVQYLVQPLKGAVQVNLDPAGRRGDVLAVVLGAPALHERHPAGGAGQTSAGPTGIGTTTMWF